MRTVLLAAIAVAIGLGFGPGIAAVPFLPTIGTDLAEHGGGCRKSSPPGQCCHKNHKTGEVHCH